MPVIRPSPHPTEPTYRMEGQKKGVSRYFRILSFALFPFYTKDLRCITFSSLTSYLNSHQRKAISHLSLILSYEQSNHLPFTIRLFTNWL